MVFSLGHTFENIPQDLAISPDVLMQPLQTFPATGTSAVMSHLIVEDNHPPVYFVLAHWWMQLFAPDPKGYLSLWGARSLPALFGVASIPAVYGLSKAAFRSSLVGMMAAAMMAVSPYGIFLAQEARHYTLAILLVIASLSCLAIATRHIYFRTPLPVWLALIWVLINTLGIATHYFFILTLCAEALVLLVFGWRFRLSEVTTHPQSFRWWRIVAVAVGTVAGGLVWLPQWQHTYTYGSEEIHWLYSSHRSLLEWINPVFQSIAAWLTMICLLPVESPAFLIVIASGGIMLIFFVWAIPILYRGIKAQWQQHSTRLATGVLEGFVLGAIAIFFTISYALAFDITRGARYSFVYFPAVIVLVGASLAVCWDTPEVKNGEKEILNSSFPLPHTKKRSRLYTPPLLKTKGKRAVALIWAVGLLSGLTVVCNLGYRKYYRPDLLVSTIQQMSSVPVLIATTHNNLIQTGEMMGIAWEFKRVAQMQTKVNPQFLLVHQDRNKCEGKECRATTILQQTLTQLPRPTDLWLINFQAPVELEAQKCLADNHSFPPVYGYEYKLYHCMSQNKG
ncbi:MAG: hypothetical protein NVSMB70_08830 [Chamaesiphon sp.]